jgi:hypothetical protein
MMETKELLELYKSLFDTWRFQVDSHWQRSSYFAAFETVAIAGCWKLLVGQYPTELSLATLGIGLTIVWILNNNKTHEYAQYWLRAICKIEARLQECSGERDIDFALQILSRPHNRLLRHPNLVQAVPALFFIAWLILFGLGVRLLLVKFATMRQIIYESIPIMLGVASLVVSISSAIIAQSSLIQTKKVAEREQREWRERKWIEMYLKANEVHDALDRFRVLSSSWSDHELEREWNYLMSVIRSAHAMAVVFPINPALDTFLKASAVFKTETTVSDELLSKVFDAIELIRDKAKMDLSVV